MTMVDVSVAGASPDRGAAVFIVPKLWRRNGQEKLPALKFPCSAQAAALAADQPYEEQPRHGDGEADGAQHLLGKTGHLRGHAPGGGGKPAVEDALDHQRKAERHDQIAHRDRPGHWPGAEVGVFWPEASRKYSKNSESGDRTICLFFRALA